VSFLNNIDIWIKAVVERNTYMKVSAYIKSSLYTGSGAVHRRSLAATRISYDKQIKGTGY
jgi:hypothetical protein